MQFRGVGGHFITASPRVTPLQEGHSFATLARTEAEKKRAMKRWYHSFKWLILLLYVLAMSSFVTFMMMCSRVVKIKFHHCDDDFGDLCLVTGSKLGWAPLAAVSFIALYIIVRHIQTKREHERSNRTDVTDVWRTAETAAISMVRDSAGP